MALNHKDLMKIIDEWPIWIGFIFLFLPGILYQLQIVNIILSNFSGSLVLVFLAISLYYSLPFLIGGFFLFVASQIISGNKQPRRIKKGEFLLISSFTICAYFFNWILHKSFGKLLLYLFGDPFWGGYIILTLLILILIIAVALFEFIKQKKEVLKMNWWRLVAGIVGVVGVVVQWPADFGSWLVGLAFLILAISGLSRK